MIKPESYVPILKWKQSEYQTLLRLDANTKTKIVPLLVIPPIDYDHEEAKLKRNIDEHLEKFATRLKEKWGTRLCLVDMHNSVADAVMANGDLAINFVLSSLADNNCTYIPVANINCSTNYISALSADPNANNGYAFRLSLDDIARADISTRLVALCNALNTAIEDVDIVVDLNRPETFLPYDGFSNLISHYILALGNVMQWRSLTIAGTSLDMQKVNKPGGEFDRHEWLLYKEILNSPLGQLRRPTFGDYTIESPDFSDIDFRFVKPAGKLIYLYDEFWLIRKGGSFRDDSSQMFGHCQFIVHSGKFMGAGFSHGDQKISDIESKASSNYSTLGTWKQVGMTHHITLVTEQLANLP
ncbi:MAG: beta family protein [Pseudohongiellaceae bacterium]